MTASGFTLIAEVHKRRPIWDQKHFQHHSRTVLDNLWDEVAQVMNSPRLAVRVKWKNMKDHFRKLIKKDNGDNKTTSWPYFERLMFLKGQMLHLQTPQDTSSCPSTHFLDVSIPQEQVDAVVVESIDSQWKEDVEKYGLIIPDSIQEDEYDNYEPIENSAKKQKVDYEENDDFHFFMSLLPSMKAFSTVQKLRIRNKIQQLIIEETLVSNNNQ